MSLRYQFDTSTPTGVLHLRGNLNRDTITPLYKHWKKMEDSQKNRNWEIHLKDLEGIDSSGNSFLELFSSEIQQYKKQVQFLGKKDFKLPSSYHSKQEKSNLEKEQASEFDFGISKLGKGFHQIFLELQNGITFLGESTYWLFRSISRPSTVRWKDVWVTAEKTGVDAFFIIALIGFLLGLIMSFQSAIPMQRFGAEIFVANLVGLSLFRELGPLMTAFILSGRSGSAYAAEIGTMKVNEEVDALTTMGLPPTQFLVVPRILACVFVNPLLTMVFNLFGLLGGAIVLYSFGFPFVTFKNQIMVAVKINDMMGGLLKSLVFGFIISTVGCYRGLGTKVGAGAVGESTTAAVVGSIIIVSFVDGIFSVLFFYLGI